jgi:hypothetical protein
MTSPGRWLTVGSAVLGVGALLAISWLIYVQQSGHNFWSWPGTTGTVIGGIGIVMLLVGLVLPKDEPIVHQVQHGGNQSVNLQVGRDINLRNGKSGE